ncbi:MAG: GNAT family N-acetyltransferase [Alphaproteobacteria bacterium]|nr:GNAT family N-acetyltransferase [Alphaproteobacteria bacterium]
MTVLSTERLSMRPPGSGDFALYCDFFADSEASHFYGGPKPPVEAWKRLAVDVGHWAMKGFGVWILVDQQSGAALGACGLYHPDGWPRAELTWWLLPSGRGRGHATEASRAAIGYGYETLGWDRVETHFKDENSAAAALVARLGGVAFARERFPDGVERSVYAFPRTD